MSSIPRILWRTRGLALEAALTVFAWGLPTLMAPMSIFRMPGVPIADSFVFIRLFGERERAGVDRPVLILDATQDELYKENALIHEHLGTPDRAMKAFVGPNQETMCDAEMVARMAHSSAASFGCYLQDRQELARCSSEELVAHHDDLVWACAPVSDAHAPWDRPGAPMTRTGGVGAWPGAKPADRVDWPSGGPSETVGPQARGSALRRRLGRVGDAQ